MIPVILFVLGVTILGMVPGMVDEALKSWSPGRSRVSATVVAAPHDEPGVFLPLLQILAIMLLSGLVFLILAAMMSVIYF